METLADRLLYARRKKGIRQVTIAEDLGLTRSSISHWETGTVKDLSASSLIAISTYLDVSPRWLVTGYKPTVINVSGLTKKQIKAIKKIVKLLQQ